MCLQDFEILSEDTLVAVWSNKELSVVNQKLLPQFLKRVSNAELWLETRAVDSHRPNSRMLKKALRMKERDDVATVIRANGATITDNYWIRPIGSDLKYSQISFNDAYYKRKVSQSMAKLALSGSSRSFNFVADNPSVLAAELTNIGSFEKCWKRIEGEWWLYKRANHFEAFSEIYISKLCYILHIPCALYEQDKTGFVRSLDFTAGKVNFEPAISFMGDNEDYEDVVTELNSLCPSAIPDFVKMVFLDALVFNPDRHTANFGLLRNKKTGKYTSLAPCFDHNMALFSKGYPEGNVKNDLLIKLFIELIDAHPEYKKYIPKLTHEKAIEAFEQTNMKMRRDVVVNYIMERYDLIMKSIEKESAN